ncbi:MAG TPA: T9SS type A sorting domain-containing protein, partial [Emticicia sp.]
VPDAVFVDGQGYIPLSLYLHGRTSGEVTGLKNIALKKHHVKLFPNPASDYLSLETDGVVKIVAVYDILGKKVMAGNIESLNISSLQSGLYLLKILFEDDQVIDRKFIKQ